MQGAALTTQSTSALAQNSYLAYQSEQQNNRSFSEKYFDINSPKSVLSKQLFAAANFSFKSTFTHLGSSIISGVISPFRTFFSPAYAAGSDPYAAAKFAGIETYDFPRECINADPLTMTPQSSTNADELGIFTPEELTWDMLSDKEAYYSALYSKVGDNEDLAKKVWNCAVFDNTIRGGIGALYGYKGEGAFAMGAGSAVSPTGGLGSLPDGFTFPLKTTQSAIINDKASNDAYGAPWCYNKTTNCHHDYEAADIFVETGTEVVSPVDGEVVTVHDQDNSDIGSRITIKSSKDGVVYYMAHMKDGSIVASNISQGDTVKSGQVIGQVGTNKDAVGTIRHLHIDALPAKYPARVLCSGKFCAGYPFISIQPILSQAFKALPE
jgi:murein DD-endopeptidase MepM/ murein hydrolase activator NlpD